MWLVVYYCYQTDFCIFCLHAESNDVVTFNDISTYHGLFESLQVLLGLRAAVNLEGQFGQFSRLDRFLLLQAVKLSLDILQVETQFLARPEQIKSNSFINRISQNDSGVFTIKSINSVKINIRKITIIYITRQSIKA